MDFIEKRAKYLLDKGMAYVGMIAEISSKCRLLKLQSCEAEDPDFFQADATKRLQQMKKDLTRYSRKIHRIYEELENYGIISKLE